MTTNFSISKTELLNRLQTVSKIIPRKCTLPIMENVLLDIQDGIIRISAADPQGRINTPIDGILTDNNICICVDAKLLIAALSELPEQPLTITIDDKFNITIKYKGGKFEMVGLSSAEFPKEKDVTNATRISLPSKVLLNGIEKTFFCASTDELRPIMASVYLDITKGQIGFVASDGHKLALLELRDESMTEKISFALPLKIATILKNNIKPSDEEVNIFIGGNYARFEYGSDSIVATLLEGNYPNYRSVLPQGNDKILSIGAADLKGAIKRVSVFANQASSLVKLELLNDLIKLSAQDIDFSTAADETVPCEYSNNPMAIGFKGHFLTELISAIPTSNLQMSFSDPSRATLITPVDDKSEDKLTYLLMPMMLAD
ncbi:MAG: DNA polymerase III subunit beta [Bacteroides xylanisolvens]